jgi:signal transduction histidine kinase
MGSGVGLQLAKVMLELEGGSLIVDSVPGDGTIIGLIFPARIVAVAPLRLRA